MTSAEITALVVALGTLVTVFGGVVVNIIVALKTRETVAEVNQKADVITGHVNSAASASAAKIDGMQKELTALLALVADQKETAALLAQASAGRSRASEGNTQL